MHITRMETLKEAYQVAKRNAGAPGIDGLTFEDIEKMGVDVFLASIRGELLSGNCKPQGNRKAEIPKDNGKVRVLQIPTIRDRVVQGALKIILEAIFEADFCDNSYGFRPRRSQHLALAEVRRSITRRMSMVIDVDLSKYFDTINHSVLLGKIAKRVEHLEVMRLIKQILSAVGRIGVPQGGPLSPLAANIYLNEEDWFFDEIRKKTKQGDYEAVNYHRYADDIVITVSGHHTKRGWVERALQRLREQLVPLKVELNLEKTKVVKMLKGESFGFLGFDLRKVRNLEKSGYFICMTPKKKARKAIKAEIRKIIQHGGSTPMKDLITQINPKVAGWVEFHLLIQLNPFLTPYGSLAVQNGGNSGGFIIMKQPKVSELVIDRKATKRIRSEVAKTKKIKITINIDQDSLEAVRELAVNTGGSYQKLLNQVLKDGLKRRNDADSRLDRIERELERLKKTRAA